MHLTETCEPDAPHLVTNVETTVASVSDMEMTPVIHNELAARGGTPDIHLVDAGYVDAHNLATARHDHGVSLLGPVKSNTGWQAKAGAGFSIDAFTVDWDNQRVICPSGKASTQWGSQTHRTEGPVFYARFLLADCRPCPSRPQCTRARRREITFRPRGEHEALAQARIDQQSPDWQRRYSHRAGVEGTIAQGVHAFGLRRARCRGLAKTRLQHQLTGAAMNFARLDAWLTGRPLAPTRTSPFAALRPAG
ncbi:transposase [Streptomyces sp. NPDC005989]|uniref:transposase n=1 Tax=Streptomyces sp. NPDC005989 TaxID=3156727 RepID=UPI0033D8C6D1